MAESSLSFVSVIVPVFNQATGLRRCLEALQQQSYPSHLYEVVVVDNGSDPGEDIAGVVAQFAQAVFTTESQPGSYAARNRGISLAKGPVIAFTDADCIPASDWLEQGVAILQSTPNCGLVGGQIVTTFQDCDRPTAIELYESLWYPLSQKDFVEQEQFAATANVLTRVEVLQTVGVFDSTLKSHGDREWGQRVHAAGYSQQYAENVRVSHPARHSLDQLYSRARRIMGGRYDLQQKQPSFWRRNGLFVATLATYSTAPFLMLGFNFLGDRRLKTLEQKFQVSWVMFFVSYVYVWEMIRLKCGGSSHRG